MQKRDPGKSTRYTISSANAAAYIERPVAPKSARGDANPTVRMIAKKAKEARELNASSFKSSHLRALGSNPPTISSSKEP